MLITIETEIKQSYEIEVSLSTTFSELKWKMEEASGAKASCQTLLLNNLGLIDNYDVGFYEVKEGTCFKLKYECNPTKLKFSIVAKIMLAKTLTEEFTLEVDEAMTVANLKKKIQKVSHIRIDRMSLFYMYNEMEDAYPLFSYFVYEDSAIQVIQHASYFFDDES